MIPVISIPAQVPVVPFYSQFADVSSQNWKKRSCGVVSVAMVLDYYSDESISVDKLLTQAIKSGAYTEKAGWTHKGLIALAKAHGLTGEAYDLTTSSSKTAFASFSSHLSDGPVIVSVHYKFDPKSTIPHLVVIDGIKDGYVYYNDPAASGGSKKIAVAEFLKGWKQRFIVLRPTHKSLALATDVEPAQQASTFFERVFSIFS
jgi:predicted double-glycine peptidase